ncbi:MAG: LysR family transcriptional regulator [Candidatus Faecousia sp.]|nr:LysR family transcriptional regulator [Candidatus Faecousia sp.]
MNLKQAQYIKTIAECGSVTAAAKKLFVSQPSLSQMLRQVEQEIGLPLFDRSVSPLRPTYAGEKYLQAADRMLAANAELESQLREIRHEHAGRLRLGISVTRAMQVMPLVLPIFLQQYPNVTLQLTESGSATLEELLRTGSIDLALAALESTSPSLAYELIEKETIGILAGRYTAVARQYPSGTPLSLDAVCQENFVCLTKSHSSRITQDKLFRRFGLSPNVLLETDALEVGRRVALEAGACMILPNIYIDDYCRQHRGAFFPLKDYENHRHFYACYRKDEFVPRYVRDFIQITVQVLAKQREKDPAFPA